MKDETFICNSHERIFPLVSAKRYLNFPRQKSLENSCFDSCFPVPVSVHFIKCFFEHH